MVGSLRVTGAIIKRMSLKPSRIKITPAVGLAALEVNMYKIMFRGKVICRSMNLRRLRRALLRHNDRHPHDATAYIQYPEEYLNDKESSKT